MPKVEFIDLSHNQLDAIRELQNLSALTHLDMSYNKIRRLESLHTKLGNIKSINLAGNKLESLAGKADIKIVKFVLYRSAAFNKILI